MEELELNGRLINKSLKQLPIYSCGFLCFLLIVSTNRESGMNYISPE